MASRSLRYWLILALAVLAVLAGSPAAAADRAALERAFQSWLQRDIWPQARARGISRPLFERATAGLTPDWSLPDLAPPGMPAPGIEHQSEFRPPARYFDEGRIGRLVARGRGLLDQWAGTLDAIERRFHVPRGIIVAIWGRESDYGRAAERHDALRVLATRAFMGRRKALFEPELIAALRILQDGHVRPGGLKSSWAGAMGAPQFLPSKFLQFAVDFDGDGRLDIWNSVPDILASIANYLAAHGWRRARDWGYEAVVPAALSCTLEGPEKGKPIAEWVRLGVRRISGRPFPAQELPGLGHLMMPAGRFGPAFVATPNFYVLKSYNESDLYALFIGHLADRYGANRPFAAPWRRIGVFSRGAVQAMQRGLEAAGHDVGGADGLIGFKTRIAVGEWQARRRLAPTCFPDAELMKKIR